MVKQNLTVQLDDAIVDKAKVLAARRRTSVSELVAMEIERLASEDAAAAYQRAAALTCQQLEKPFHMGGGPLPSRDQLHER